MIWRVFVLIVVAGFILIFASLPARPQAVERMAALYCYEKEFRGVLYRDGLAPVDQGLTYAETVLEVWRSANYAKWALTVTTAEGVICLFGGGTDFENILWHIPPNMRGPPI